MVLPRRYNRLINDENLELLNSDVSHLYLRVGNRVPGSAGLVTFDVDIIHQREQETMATERVSTDEE